LRALARATRRDLRGLESVKVNNFFLFVALLIYGALVSGVRPASSYPFLLLLGFLLLFPLSSDPLARIPPSRLGAWPLAAGSKWALRLASLVLSPVFWGAVFLAWRVSLSLAAIFAVLAFTMQAIIVLPPWSIGRWIPPLPGRLGVLVQKNIRQMLSVLDTWLALVLSIAGCVYRMYNPDPDGLKILSMLVALALSTYGQCLFALDSDSGRTRYGLLPLQRWEILAAKDLAYVIVLLVLVAPVHLATGLTFGLTALAIGHIPSTRLRLPQQRWRFTSGHLVYGAAQSVLGTMLANWVGRT